MKWFPALQQKIGGYLFKRKQPLKDPNPSTQGQHFGIILDARDRVNLDAVRKYTGQLQKNAKSFTVFAYVGQQSYPEENNFIFINEDDLNWYYHPKPHLSSILNNQYFDTLISFHQENDLIFEYLSVFIPAKLKIGSYLKHTDYFSLIINAPNITQFLKMLDYLMASLKKKRKHESKALETV